MPTWTEEEYSQFLASKRQPVKQIVDDKSQTEKLFQQKIINLAKANDWYIYHTHDSRRSEPGFPDLCITRAGRLIFAEVKTLIGKVSDAQADWLNELSITKAEVYTWRPNDWETICRVLK